MMKSAERRYGRALSELGNCNNYGLGTLKDEYKACELYLKVIEKGCH